MKLMSEKTANKIAESIRNGITRVIDGFCELNDTDRIVITMLIPAGFFALLVMILTVTVPSCYGACDMPTPPPMLVLSVVGTVTLTDGERCTVEEVQRWTFLPGMGDRVPAINCNLPGVYEGSKVMQLRRLSCASGKVIEQSVASNGR